MAGTTTPTEEQGIFDGMDLSEILAFTYHSQGAEVLQSLLDKMVSEGPFSQEMLFEAAGSAVEISDA
jgi:hypothetical protein